MREMSQTSEKSIFAQWAARAGARDGRLALFV